MPTIARLSKRKSDEEIVTAVESQDVIAVDISGDSETVDGKNASDLDPRSDEEIVEAVESSFIGAEIRRVSV